MTHIFCHILSKKIGILLLAVLFLFCNESVLGQSTTVLPNNSTYSNNNSPQGALRYQRGFYLITPAEMGTNGFTSGMTINSIGFTLARAQSDTTKGKFKLYLQNTNDVISRSDTGWTTVTSTSNSYLATGLFPGSHEWQVQSNCSTNSAFAPIVNFTNNNLNGCNNPYNLETKNIGSTSANFSWEASSSAGFTNYRVEYTALDAINWIAVNTTDTLYQATGLSSGKLYQWRVTTVCGLTNSPINYANFSTLPTSGCASLTGLTATVSRDTVIVLEWTADTTASYYEFQFRRAGTIDWSGGISFTDSARVVLSAGTSYEWQVRMICGTATTGSYTSSTFTTGGATVCYTPVQPVTRQIKTNSALLSWKAVPGATYTIRYRLKRSISWANAIAAMTLASDSIMSVPDTTGPYTIPFKNGSPFTYTGAGVYVAWEYTRPSGALSTSNLTLSTNRGTSILSVNGQDSINNLLSMVTQADTSLNNHSSVLSETRLRPETRFHSAGLRDSVSMIAVHALGFTTPKFQSPTPIQALVANLSTTNKSYIVTLTVKAKQSGIIRYTVTQNILVPASDTSLVSFTGWSPTISEQDSIIVSVPAQPNENVVNNNRKAYLQEVNNAVLAYDDGSNIVSQEGFGTGSGLLLNKHFLQGCGKIIAAKVLLTESALGKPLYAVVRNAAGAIVAQSQNFTAAQADVNKYHSFSFTTPASLLNEIFYVGIAQTASTTACYPIGAQWEDAQTRTGAYYRAALDGSGLMDFPQAGRLMIRAEIVSSAPEVIINGNLTLCAGGTNTLTAGSIDTRFANAVVAFSSQYASNDYSSAQALGSPNVFPAYELSPGAWTSASAQGQREYLELSFANPSKINFVDIFETSNPGAIDSIFVKNPATSAFELVYSTTASAAPLAARKNHISFTETSFNVSTIRIAINSPAVPGYNAIDAVGIGKEITPGLFSSYLWSPGGETTATKNVTTAGDYTVTTTNANGCTSSAKITVVAAITTVPVVTASGPISFCPGGSVTLTSSQTSGIVWSNGATTPSIIVSAAGSYTVTYTAGTCGSLTSTSTVVNINAVPTVNISGLLDICLGNQNSLDAGAGFSSHLWSTGQTTRTILISTAGNYSVTVTNASGCRASASITAVYAVLAAPVISGNLNFCPGGSTVLDAGAGYSTHLWSTGATTRTISVTAAGTYSVTVTNAGGCTAAASVNTSLFTSPSVEISGIAGFCSGSSTTLTAPIGFASYLWSTGAITPSITVNTIGTRTVTVTDGNGCTGSSNMNITAFPNPTPVIAGTLSFCGGTNTTLNAGVGFESYSWNTGATTQSIIVGAVGTYTVSVVNLNGCTASVSVATTQAGATPVSPGMITGPNIVACNSTGNVYSIAFVANTSHYVWMLPTGASINNGQGTTSITVNFAANFAGGFIEVAASNACGQSPSISARSIHVQSTANTPGTITGQNTGLCGNLTRTFSILSVPLATSYTWTAPQGTTIVNGQGTRSISLFVNAGFSFGDLCVKANNGCGSSAASCTTLSGLSPTPGAITGPTVLCSSAQNVSYGVPAVPGATSYTWTVPQASQITSGQGTNSILVRIGNKSGDVSVRTNSNCGTSAVRSLAILVNNCNGSNSFVGNRAETEIRPIPEVISAYGGHATAANVSVDWTMGEMMVENKRSNEMLYTQGFHQPIVNASKQTSLIVSENILFSVYPNPVVSFVNVEFETVKDRNVTISLVDANGKSLQTKSVNTSVKKTLMQLLGYSVGSYYLIIKDQSGKTLETIKLIKANQ